MNRLGILYRKNIMLNPELGKLKSQPVGVFCLVFSPSEVAHLATVKEQSRKNLPKIVNGSPGLIMQVMTRGICRLHESFNLSFGITFKTSIRQYLPVLAMSDLTTSDLEKQFAFFAIYYPNSIVTPVDDDQSFNTAPEEVQGEEHQMMNDQQFKALI